MFKKFLLTAAGDWLLPNKHTNDQGFKIPYIFFDTGAIHQKAAALKWACKRRAGSIFFSINFHNASLFPTIKRKASYALSVTRLNFTAC
jgi:hypothetical protein